MTKEQSEKYIEIVKNGNKDDMFDFGVSVSLERVRGIIDWELTPHGYESDDKDMEHFACELKEKYKNKILAFLDKPLTEKK